MFWSCSLGLRYFLISCITTRSTTRDRIRSRVFRKLRTWWSVVARLLVGAVMILRRCTLFVVVSLSVTGLIMSLRWWNIWVFVWWTALITIAWAWSLSNGRMRGRWSSSCLTTWTTWRTVLVTTYLGSSRRWFGLRRNIAWNLTWSFTVTAMNVYIYTVDHNGFFCCCSCFGFRISIISYTVAVMWVIPLRSFWVLAVHVWCFSVARGSIGSWGSVVVVHRIRHINIIRHILVYVDANRWTLRNVICILCNKWPRIILGRLVVSTWRSSKVRVTIANARVERLLVLMISFMTVVAVCCRPLRLTMTAIDTTAAAATTLRIAVATASGLFMVVRVRARVCVTVVAFTLLVTTVPVRLLSHRWLVAVPGARISGRGHWFWTGPVIIKV